MVFNSVLVTRFRPYKEERGNTLDVIMLLALIVMYISTGMDSVVTIPKWVNSAALSMTSLHAGVKFISTITSSKIGTSDHGRGVLPRKKRF